MPSSQSLSLADRRLVAAWAADCAERVLWVFEEEAPADDRPRDAIARARAFARGELDAAGEIRRRFAAGRAAHAVTSPAAKAATAAPDAGHAEIAWQLEHLCEPVKVALRRLPLLGDDSSGPLGPGLLTSGVLGASIRTIQDALHESAPGIT